MPLFRMTLLALTLFCSVSISQDSRAVAILKRAQEAAGGVDALSAIRDQIISRGIHSVGGDISGQQVVKIILPSALRQESALPFGMVTLSLVDGSGEMESPQGSMQLSGPQLLQAQGELFRVRERLLLADRFPELKLVYLDSVDEDSKPADVLDVTDSESGQSVQLWIDRATGELFKTTYDGVALAGAQRLEEHYSDFRSVNGVRTPFAIASRTGDLLLTEIQIEKVLHNTGLTKAELR
jgi:outer membrane lipoprotein-sorting protein